MDSTLGGFGVWGGLGRWVFTPGLGSPFFPLLAQLLLWGLVIPMCQMIPQSLSQNLMGTPLCNKLAQDPGVKTLPKGHPDSDLSLRGGERDAGGQGCPKDGGHQVQRKYCASGQWIPV